VLLNVLTAVSDDLQTTTDETLIINEEEEDSKATTTTSLLNEEGKIVRKVLMNFQVWLNFWCDSKNKLISSFIPLKKPLTTTTLILKLRRRSLKSETI
jgi:hypothetical protein